MTYNNNEKPSLENVIMSAVAEALRNTHTNLIAKITKVNKTTINCKPVISRVVNDKKIDLPEFAQVPIMNLTGGTSSIQMPLAVGDYCILFVNERCFDTWYNGQDFEKPLEARIMDYSDSIALVGIQNKAGELDIPTVITILGDAYQEGNYEHIGNRDQEGNYNIVGNQTIEGDYTQTGNMTITGDFELTGNMQVNGNITCTGVITGATMVAGNFTGAGGGAMTSSVDIVSDGKSLQNHDHPYTWTDPAGSGNTGSPN